MSNGDPRGQVAGPTERQREILHQTLNPHSVELTLTSAGKVSGSVKIYDEDPLRAFTRACEILDKIKAQYSQG